MILANTGNTDRTAQHRRDPVDAPQRRTITPPRDAGEPITPAHTRSLRLSVQRPDPGVVVVGVGGEIDLSSVSRLAELVRQRLTAATLRAVVLDLSEVTFFGSAGLELLLHAQRRAEARRTPLYVVLGTGAVHRLVRLTGLTDRFTTRDTATEAVAAIRHRHC
ncbi:STAS domain-containing protein [Saccharopolyspora gloriosae]|uniref:STAS domain-containing protein n=1 Tax=Saccharopolyspora gloriosae TaxID=455344 RepID=UPI001FB788CD|nr:STAS domain-containing protein [Saccharopolyspora gloriosae]